MSAIRDGLLAICDDLAADIARAAPICELSGKCCRFKEYGHTLFLSRPEAEWLLESGLPENATIDEAGCPFQIGGLCTARERRPLGCRVYYCDPRYAGVGETLSERYLARLKQLHDETGTAWQYLPLHVFLREARQPRENAPAAPAAQPPSH
jgi:hypothetical protein